ncbi:O-antigen/teichoic acid export membrane protein [Bradyrhizobium sp. GM0.4]
MMRLGSFDTSSEDGRSRERARKISLSAASSMISRICLLGSNLLLVPILLSHLGLEMFGVWVAISSFTSFLSFADLGIGNGIISSISTASGRNDIKQIRSYITNAYCLLAIVATSLLFALYIAVLSEAPIFPLGMIAEAHKPEINSSLHIFFLLFILNIPLSLIQKIQVGLQDGFQANIWQTASALIAFGAVLISVHLGGRLQDIVFFYLAAPLVTNIANTVFFFSRIGGQYRPSRVLIKKIEFVELFRIGSMFLAIQIMSALVYNSDAILISNLLGPAFVPMYSLPERLMSLPTILLSMALVPLWPAMGEAIARGEHDWVRKSLKKSLVIAVLFSALCGLVLVSAMPFILKLWVANKVTPPALLLLGLAAWKILEATSYACNAYLNGARLYRFQVITSAVLTVLAFPAKIFAYKHFGISGGAFALVLCYLICPGIPIAVKLHRVLNAKSEK